MTERDRIRAEGLLRALAAASAAVRLYPPTSDLPREAIGRFVALSEHALTAEEPNIRYVVDPDGFSSEYGRVGAGQANIAGLAESLYAHQVGRLVFSRGVTEGETLAFLQELATDPASMRAGGGLRAALGGAGVTHIAAIEVSLRQSTEEGLAGLDLTAAPLSEIAPQVADAAEKWARSASHGDGDDELATALDGLEDAARDLAAARVAEALLTMDERSRMRVLGHAMYQESSGSRMKGMSSVLARMKPAALARLLRLVSAKGGIDPAAMAPQLDLPPAVLEMVMSMLAPDQRTEEASGVPADVDPESMAEQVDEADEGEEERLLREKERAASTVAERGLRTTLALARETRTEEAVGALAEAVPPALRAGFLDGVSDAMALLAELASSPDVGVAVSAARQKVGETLLETYVDSDSPKRALLRPAMEATLDAVLPLIGRQVKTAATPRALRLLHVVGDLRDSRAVPTLNAGLEHLDGRVRQAVLEALGGMRTPEAHRVLVKAVSHWDPQTRRWAVRIIGREAVEEAVPVMLRILQGYYLFERNYELKKEVIEALEALGSAKALPTLNGMARRRLVFGRKNRELQFLARRATAAVEKAAADRPASIGGTAKANTTIEGKMARGH